MQQKGREEAEAVAEQWLDGFIARNGLDTKFERLSESLPSLAEEMRKAFTDPMGFFCNDYRIIRDGIDYVYLQRPNKALEEYLDRNFSRSEITTIKKKKDELFRLMSADNRGNTPNHRHPTTGEKIRAVKMKA
jgi:hypothetical protein